MIICDDELIIINCSTLSGEKNFYDSIGMVRVKKIEIKFEL